MRASPEWRWRIGVVATLVLVGCVAPVFAQTLRTETLRIPMSAAGPEGLDAILIEPAGSGRHPLALLSHGSPRDDAERAVMSPRDMLPQLTEFARRGFVAVTVLRRGYGSSPGGWAEGYGSCDDPDYVKAGRAGAADLRAAAASLSRRDDVDPTKIIAVGVSAGGFATVALTADPPPGLVAAISFAGGRGSSGPDTVCGEDTLVHAFSVYGERSRTPMLWVYAQNDHFFGPLLARRLYTAFTEAGGMATFVKAPAYGADGHGLFSAGGIATWTPIVDAFLQSRRLGHAAQASHLLEPPPQLSASGRKDFQTFLDATTHKAFAVSAGGAYAWRTARATVDEARDDALQSCETETHAKCRLYALDDAYVR